MGELLKDFNEIDNLKYIIEEKEIQLFKEIENKCNNQMDDQESDKIEEENGNYPRVLFLGRNNLQYF